MLLPEDIAYPDQGNHSRMVEQMGIYLSTQEIQDERITPELYQTYIEPSNIKSFRSC